MKKFCLLFLFISNLSLWGTDFIGWNRISTEHFTYIFEDFDKKTAFELADYGEEIYSIVSTFFDYYPQHIHVYINSRVDSPNGNFYPIPGSIDLFPIYPLNSENATKSSSWLYELLLHEVVHYIHLEKPIGIFGGLSRVFGRDLASANGAFLPAWMVEGIAVYLETKYTEGGRGKNLYFEAFTKASAFEDNYYSLYQLAYSSDFPPYNRIYSGGYVLINYMMETFGEEIFMDIYERYTRFPLFGPFHAVRKETGQSMHEIFAEMKNSEKTKHSQAFRESGALNSEKISPDFIGDWIHPQMTEKGILLYRSQQDKPPAIVALDPHTGEEDELINVSLIEKGSFSSDYSGDVILFSSGDYEFYHSFGTSLRSRLYINEKGSTRVLSYEDSLLQPAISPDGQQVVAVKRLGSYSKLVSIDRETGQTSDLFSEPEVNIMNPCFSPDGKELLFVVNDKGMQDIYAMSLSDPGSAVPLFGIDRASEYHPRFTGDEGITFISDRSGELAMYLLNRRTGEIEVIFRDPVGMADGFLKDDQIYYQAYRTDGYQLRKSKPGHGNEIAISAAEEKKDQRASGTYEVSRHFDLAIPYLWLPKPYVEISQSEGWLWGGGAAFFAGSYSQSTEWLLDINYLPGPGQPVASFDYSRDIYRTTFSYTFDQKYGEVISGSNTLWNQTTEQSALLSYPLMEKTFADKRHVLKNYIYGRHLLRISDGASYALPDSFSMESENYLYAGTGLSHSIYKFHNARTALFGGLNLTNQIDLSVLLPLLSATETTFVLKESGSFSLPLSQRGTNLMTGWEMAYHNGGVSSQAVSSRGWTPRLTSSDLSFYYTASLQIPIALVDWGLPLGFNIQNMAAAFNLEGISHAQLEGLWENEFYAGLELIGTYGYNYGSIPFGAGASFRFYRKGFGFDPAEDLKIYFFFSFNSLQP